MNLVIIDDDPIVSASLKTILELNPLFRVVAVGNDGDEALVLYDTHKPDILLMDVRMKRTSGLEAGKRVLSQYPDARIVYLTTFQDDEYVHEALSLGAKGYLLKQDYEAITVALQSVMAGQVVFGGDIVSKLTRNRMEKRIHNDALTEKDVELLKHIVKGLNNKEIAQSLGYSEGTIRNHISLLLEKLSLRDRTQLAIYYFNNINP